MARRQRFRGLTEHQPIEVARSASATEALRATLALWDYRRRVADLYAELRALPPEEGWRRWRDARDVLFGTHPQSALPPDARSRFAGLRYFPYDAAFRVTAAVEPAGPGSTGLPRSGGGVTPAHAFALARFRLDDAEHTLTLYRLDEYSDGVFLPIRDPTNGNETYGGGRYLLDTAKGADLGEVGEAVTLDFNFAYHPSCAHDPGWSCPLPPPGNRLEIPITAGERLA